LCTYTFHNKLNKKQKEKIWFKLWITEGYSIRQLEHISKHSHSKLKRIIQYWLNKPPEPRNEFSTLKYLVFDGTFLHGRKSIIALMDGSDHSIHAGRYGIRENSASQLGSFFLVLTRKGLCPKSATIDGNPHVIRFFRTIWPNIIIQRCLVHIQRQGLSWCRRFPKRTDAKHLRKIFQRVTYLRTKEDKERFILLINQWEQKYGKQIAVSPEIGWVFSDLKRARSMLLKALPDMFHYLDDPNISFSTNGLEGYFSRLKANYRRHRGLSPKHRKNYFQWYFYLKNR
jgi:hypothetical protein